MNKSKKQENKQGDTSVNLNAKLEASIRLLIEKLNQAGIDTKDKEIIIINGKLTIN